jgi:hypothetical protein
MWPAIPPNGRQRTEQFFCQRCGAQKVVTQIIGSKNREVLESESHVAPTDLSAWYESHYPSPCEHVWRRSDLSDIGYFAVGSLRIQAGGGAIGSGWRPSLLHLGERERRELEERYEKDKGACLEYISAALREGLWGQEALGRVAPGR